VFHTTRSEFLANLYGSIEKKERGTPTRVPELKLFKGIYLAVKAMAGRLNKKIIVCCDGYVYLTSAFIVVIIVN
jgi:hypothetical protein